MSAEPPPPPQVSPDGRFYWNGERWVLMQVPAPPLVSPDGQFYWDGVRWEPLVASVPEPEERHERLGREYWPGATIEDILNNAG